MRFAPVLQANARQAKTIHNLTRLTRRQEEEIANLRLALSEALQETQALERQVRVLSECCPSDLRELEER